MSCEICGRGSCMRSFHSLEEQEEVGPWLDKIDDLRDRLREKDEEIERLEARIEELE